LLLRLITEQDIEHVRQWMSPAERSVLFALRLGIKLGPAQVSKTFHINRYQAGRLIKKIEDFARENSRQ
jgi:hypothetical protein